MTTYTPQNHAPPLVRSNSLFGAIKNIVTAPFAWFAGSEDEFEGAMGKRRRLPTVPEDAHMEDESTPSRPKRQRVSSPHRDAQPYLDPPRSVFSQPRRTSDHSASGSLRDITRSPRKTLYLPPASNQSPRTRRTVSPLPSSSRLKPLGMTRTMSLDPPSRSSFSSRIQATPTIPDLQSHANHANDLMSTSCNGSVSPRHVRVRSSLTPQPSGAGFGPVVPPRRERGLDEPPPLTALMSNPMFVKAPPGVQKQSAVEPQQQLTLGTLLESQRIVRAPARQSSILFGTGSMTDVSAPGHVWPVNKAELALHELEVYKTPLLPTRLKGASAVPDMFLHKEKKHITLMTDDRPAKPRLGTKGKGKEKGKKKERETTNGTKPYAGEGGMKKWLARRKKEEEEAKEKERAEAMEDERAEEEKRRREAEAEKKREEELKIPPPPSSAPVFEPRVSREGSSSSSLRVGRTRIGRNHIDRPVSRRAKFSAAFEDEDEDMEESRTMEHKALEEAAMKAPAFELPVGFTFAKETTITHDLTLAKEPPITSLPFSLTKSTPAPPSAPEIVSVTLAPVPVTPAPALPKIALIPPTPDAVKPVAEVPAPTATAAPASSGIPNFFANSSVFGKPAAIAPLSASLTVPAVEQPKSVEAPEPQVPKAGETTSSLFGPPSRPISAFATHSSDSAAPPPIARPPPIILKEAENPKTVLPSLASPFPVGPAAKPVESVLAPTTRLPSEQPPAAEPAKPAASSNDTIFTFGAPRAAPSPAPAAASTPGTQAAAAEAPNSVFAFGQPAPAAATTAAPATTAVPATTVAPVTTDASKSVFDNAPPATLFTFGPRSNTAPAEQKAGKSPFSFGASATVEKKSATGFTFTPTTSAAPTPPVTFSFSAAPSGTTAADVSSKPFAFGATTSARPATPPKTEQEITMDESPARDMVLNGDVKAPEKPTLNFSFNAPTGSALFAQSPATTTTPFGFGAPGTAVNPFAKEEKKESKVAVSFGGFGQTGSTGFSFGQKPPQSPATTAPATAFQFTQPSPSVAPASPFTFGAASVSANPFGQSSATSAPSSPSTFNRPSFAFGTPTTTQPAANPFGFGTGSQPVSPAAGSTTLPSGTTGGTAFTFGGGANATPAGGAGAAGTTGSLFTMGSAPPPIDGAGVRRIKGLPRRGGRR